MDAVKNVKTCAMWTLPPSGRQSDCFCSEGFLFKQAFCSSDKLPVMIIIPFILVTEKQIFLPWKSQPHLKQWCILRGNKCTVFISKSKLWFCGCFPLLINWVLQHQLQSCNNSPTMLIIIALMEVLEQCQQSLLPLFSSSSLYTSVPVWMLLCLRSVLSTHPPNCSWLCSCVWLAHFEQCISALGPCEAQKEATPAACSSAPLRRQSVSQLTIPHCYHSSWPLFLLRVPEPPVYPPAKVLHAWGPAGEGSQSGFWSDSSISALLCLFSRLLPPKQGAWAS